MEKAELRIEGHSCLVLFFCGICAETFSADRIEGIPEAAFGRIYKIVAFGDTCTANCSLLTANFYV